MKKILLLLAMWATALVVNLLFLLVAVAINAFFNIGLPEFDAGMIGLGASVLALMAAEHYYSK